jgi:MFS superfamily sulfate permease-like transporter
MLPKITTSVLTGAAIACLALPLISMAHAQAAPLPARQVATQCKIVGAISHRCYTFHSDATWREGLADYHGANGG